MMLTMVRRILRLTRMPMAMLIIRMRMGVLIDDTDDDHDEETFHNHQGARQVGCATEGRRARKSPLGKL